jgi:hypothetical protein
MSAFIPRQDERSTLIIFSCHSYKWPHALWKTIITTCSSFTTLFYSRHHDCDHLTNVIKICKVWGYRRIDYEEFLLLGYKLPVRTSQETHYVSATETSLLMICKIWGFHGVDYEECRLLGYKNSVHTSQEKHYVPATDPSRLWICKIWGLLR